MNIVLQIHLFLFPKYRRNNETSYFEFNWKIFKSFYYLMEYHLNDTVKNQNEPNSRF